MPAGQWLLSGSPGTAAAGRLALLQWGAFVLPTLYWMRSKGWDVRAVLQLQQLGTLQQWLAGLAAGPVLWALINAAIAIKTGNTDTWLAAAGDAANSSSGSSPGVLLLGGGGSEAGVGWGQLPQLLLAAAVSPAVAEELLFRGFLLTALQERLGRIDAVAVCAALFALIHLEPQQFFLYCVLGGAAGAAAVRSGSLGPAVALHLGFNAAAVVAGLALHVK
ncbi:hypothetical protein OEZ86_010019 [Tetradesmus obliquus]|nr:hypothetical protein OEZ86_010019 [Tetradesmus obliquus]